MGKVSLGWVLLFYSLLFGLTYFGGRIKSWLAGRTGGKPLTSTTLPAVALMGLGITTVLVWRGFLSAPDRRLHLTVLDVGSGGAGETRFQLSRNSSYLLSSPQLPVNCRHHQDRQRRCDE